MVKQLIPAIAVLVLLASCTSIKPLNFTSSRQVAASTATSTPIGNTQVKFIEDISITPKTGTSSTDVETDVKEAGAGPGLSYIESPSEIPEFKTIDNLLANRPSAVESATKVQLKYAVLLNTEVESLPSKYLLENVDEWYGVRYRHAGNTRKGVDCSGFSVAVYAAVYGIMLPRVSREQYRTSRRISITELQEGDLVFFDTRGRGTVSHVGVYLGNNKFIHASVSRGVMVNGLFEPYYMKRFKGAGRIDNKSIAAASTATY